MKREREGKDGGKGPLPAIIIINRRTDRKHPPERERGEGQSPFAPPSFVPPSSVITNAIVVGGLWRDQKGAVGREEKLCIRTMETIEKNNERNNKKNREREREK